MKALFWRVVQALVFPITWHFQATAAGYDKPMIYYPCRCSCWQASGYLDHHDAEDSEKFQRLLGNGEQFGINLQYTVQPSPDGLARAFILGEEFIGQDSVCLRCWRQYLLVRPSANGCKGDSQSGRSHRIRLQVMDPERFGVIEFDENSVPSPLRKNR